MQRAYPKGLVPSFDVVTTPYDTMSRATSDNRSGIDDLVHHIRKRHMRMNKPIPSEADVLAHLDKAAEGMGLSPEVGRGFFGDLWKSIKSGVKNVASKQLDDFKSDPIGTVGKWADAIGSVIDKIPQDVAPLAVV